MTNAAAIGYAILAAKRLGLDEVTIKKLDRAMYQEMDVTHEKTAEEAYRSN